MIMSTASITLPNTDVNVGITNGRRINVINNRAEAASSDSTTTTNLTSTSTNGNSLISQQSYTNSVQANGHQPTYANTIDYSRPGPDNDNKGCDKPYGGLDNRSTIQRGSTVSSTASTQNGHQPTTSQHFCITREPLTTAPIQSDQLESNNCKTYIRKTNYTAEASNETLSKSLGSHSLLQSLSSEHFQNRQQPRQAHQTDRSPPCQKQQAVKCALPSIRRMSEVSSISYSGYLLKRSNLPCQPESDNNACQPSKTLPWTEGRSDTRIEIDDRGLHFQELDETDMFLSTPTQSAHDLTSLSGDGRIYDGSIMDARDCDDRNQIPYNNGNDYSSNLPKHVSSLSTSQCQSAVFNYLGGPYPSSMRESVKSEHECQLANDTIQHCQQPLLHATSTSTPQLVLPISTDPVTQFFATILDFPALMQLDCLASYPTEGAHRDTTNESDNNQMLQVDSIVSVSEYVAIDSALDSCQALHAFSQASSPSPQNPMTVKMPISASLTTTATPAASEQQLYDQQVIDEEDTNQLNATPDTRLTHRSISEGETIFMPPPDFIDPKDFHIWRAKYCVLDGQNLFFYAHETDAHSIEAVQERRQYEETSHQGSFEQEKVLAMPRDTQRQINPWQQSRLHYQKNSKVTMTSVKSTPSLLSQSPMTRSNLVHLRMFNSSAVGDDRIVKNGSIPNHHLSPTNAMHVYEKVVPLECVGTVRSAELEYGAYTIELTAVSNTDDNEDGESDRLVIRARNKSEMNEWMFQFHRSIDTFVRDIMVHLSAGDIHHRAFQHNILSAPQLPLKKAAVEDRRREQSDGYNTNTCDTLSGGNNILTFSNIIEATKSNDSPTSTPSRMNTISYPGITMSPRYQKVICGTSTEFPSTSLSTGVLTHGHGRNLVHRRRLTLSSALSPTETTLGTMCSSQTEVEESGQISTPDDEGAMPMIQPCVQPFVARKADIEFEPTSILNEITESKVTNNTECKTILYARHAGEITPITDETRPMIRSVSEPVVNEGKYIPPFMRRMQMRAAAVANENASSDSEPQPIIRRYVPRNVRRVEPCIEIIDLTTKIGGCADPMLQNGSIMDTQYIPRSASMLKKVPTVAHGLFSEKSNTNNYQSKSRLQWEIGVVSECGRKDDNQDSYVVTNNLLSVFAEGNNYENREDPSNTSGRIWEKLGKLHPPGMFAIFDGHCGDHAARFAAERISSFIHNTSHRMDFNFEDSDQSGADDIKRILDVAIQDLDTMFCNLCVADSREWDAGATLLIATLVNEHLVVANLGDSRGIVCRSISPSDVDAHLDEGWLQLPPEEGYDNSRSYLWKVVTEVHSPSKESERERIRQANGWITTEREIPVSQLQRMMLYDEDVIDILKRCFAEHYTDSLDRSPTTTKAAAPQRIIHITRLCGELGVSRAIGDRDYKAAFQPLLQVSKEAELQSDDSVAFKSNQWKSGIDFIFPKDHSGEFNSDLVSNVPEFHVVRIGQANAFEEFLLLACDGLWDVMDEDDAFRVARGLLFDKKWSAKKTAERLAELAMRLGSSDNITVIVVRFFLSDNTSEPIKSPGEVQVA